MDKVRLERMKKRREGEGETVKLDKGNVKDEYWHKFEIDVCVGECKEKEECNNWDPNIKWHQLVEKEEIDRVIDETSRLYDRSVL